MTARAAALFLEGPPLIPDTNGNTWVVTKLAPPLAGARLWQMLLN